MSSMTAFTCQAGEPFAQRPIQPFNKSRIPDGPSLRLVQQIVRLLFLSQGQSARDLNYVLLLRAFDDRHNTQVLPDV